MADVAPQPKPRQQQLPKQQTNDTKIATRTENVVNIAETPTKVPPISTTPSGVVARPLDERFTIGRFNTDPVTDGSTVGREIGRSGTDQADTGLVAATPAKPETEDILICKPSGSPMIVTARV